MRFYLLLFLVAWSVCNANNVQLYNLQGYVEDQKHIPLPGATVVLEGECSDESTISNLEGRFSFSNIPKGEYTLKVTYIGYKSYSRSINIDRNTYVTIHMEHSVSKLNEILIECSYGERRRRMDSRNTIVVDSEHIRRNQSGSLMQSLEGLPGIGAMNIGSAQSKPAIRGLGFNRLIVAEHGIKHEAQQWGSDHGLEVDRFAADNVEIIKGPASLKYGSDAISGVIDIKQNFVPEPETIGGSLDVVAESNNDMLGSSLSLYGRKNGFFVNSRITRTGYGDYKVPTDSVDIYSYRVPLYKNRLRNTAGNEMNMHLTAGLIRQSWNTRLFLSRVNHKSGFFANAHGLEPRMVDKELYDKSSRDIMNPYQKVEHTKIINNSRAYINGLLINLKLGFQNNFRREYSNFTSHGFMPAVFPDTLDFSPDLEREFSKNIFSGKVESIYSFSDNHVVSAGIDTELQNNDIDGRNFIIPAYRQFSAGVFVLDEWIINDNSVFNIGLRYDFSNLETRKYYDWYMTNGEFLKRAPGLSRNFSSISGAAGFNYSNDDISFRINAGKSFRVPTAKELAANGVNYHLFSYEKGDTTLKPEVAYQMDLGIEYKSGNYNFMFSPFVSYFPNYIYLNPSYRYDYNYGAGNQIFNYTSTEVGRVGGELYSGYNILPALKAGITAEYVYSVQMSGDKEGFTIPFSPPASAILNIRYEHGSIGRFTKAFIEANCRITAAQNLIVPPEQKTPGYRVFNISIGTSANILDENFDIYFNINNVFNHNYLNHTSYYRLIGVPEPGRNFNISIKIPFKI